MIRSGLYEFGSRGLTWGRVLLVAPLMSADAYGYLILLLSAEALLGGFISYPQIKDLLLQQCVHFREIVRTALMFALFLPLSVLALGIYFSALLPVAAVLVGAFFFGVGQVLLYLHRIDNIARYNRLKILAAVLSTAIFFVVLPIEPLLFPVVQLSYCAALAIGFRADSRFSFSEIFEDHPWSSLVRTWGVFGTQSLVANAQVYGSRLIVGAALGLGQVKIFTMTFMVASGITFYFAAVMIYAEKDLSKSITIKELPLRFRTSFRTLLFLWGGLAVYGILGFAVWGDITKDIEALLSTSLNPNLFAIFFAVFALRAITLVINPVIIALGRRVISLVASIVSALALLVATVFSWDNLTLVSIAWIMFLSVLCQVIVLSLGFYARRL